MKYPTPQDWHEVIEALAHRELAILCRAPKGHIEMCEMIATIEAKKLNQRFPGVNLMTDENGRMVANAVEKRLRELIAKIEAN